MKRALSLLYKRDDNSEVKHLNKKFQLSIIMVKWKGISCVLVVRHDNELLQFSQSLHALLFVDMHAYLASTK